MDGDMRIMKVIWPSIVIRVGKALLLVSSLLAVASVSAADESRSYWNCYSGDWDVASCWESGSLPGVSDWTYVNPVHGMETSMTIRDGNPTVTDLGLNAYGGSWSWHAPGSAMVTVSQTGGILSATYEEFGSWGPATYLQTGGKNSTQGLEVGGGPGTGLYQLSGTASLFADYEHIGTGGLGMFIQQGGTNTLTYFLVLGWSSGASGSYHLSGGALLADDEAIGQVGVGAFTQTGGSNAATFLHVARYAGGRGTYQLGGGRLLADQEYIGDGGTGTFSLDNGTNTVNGVVLGNYSGASGTYSLSGSGRLSADNEYVGVNGTGTFTQTGGTNTVTTITLRLGDSPGAAGTYHMQGGTLTADTIQVNPGGVFDFSGGVVSVNAFKGDLTNGGGTVAPGGSSGITTIIGDYTVTDPASTLEIQIGGLLTGTDYDVLDVSGTANIGGILDVSLWNGFTPSLGDSFDILTAGTINGMFDTLLFPSSGGLSFDISYLLNPTGIDILRLTTVSAVPEPSSWFLIGSALVGLMVMKKRVGV